MTTKSIHSVIKDEYEILAFNDLSVAHAYLDTLAGVLRSLKAENSPLYGNLEQSYLGLSEFSYKYKHRLEDISAISSKIDEARSKHRSIVAKVDVLSEQNAQLTKQLERARELCIDLQYENEKLKEQLSDALEGLKSFLPI